MGANRTITVRISETRLRKLMCARGAATKSELVSTLLAEEEERLRSHAALRETARTVRAGDMSLPSLQASKPARSSTRRR